VNVQAVLRSYVGRIIVIMVVVMTFMATAVVVLVSHCPER
jgi:hypothetical protein